MRKRNKLGRIERSVSEEEMKIVHKWVESGVTDEERLSKKIFLHFPIKSYLTAQKYARMALDGSKK